jgi:cob(I)alamin adenosyltransferase
MSIATKRGDQGETSLLRGGRVSKANLRICANGSIDELNSALGLCRVHVKRMAAQVELRSVQEDLVRLMGELSVEDNDLETYLERTERAISESSVDALTDAIKAYESEVGVFSGWEYPGESISQAFYNHARTTCRRAERELVALRESGAQVRPVLLKYLNRLSDWLWISGRLPEDADFTGMAP